MKSPPQEFIENLFASLLSVIKVLLISKFNLKIKKINGEYACVILGNGPSLKDTLQEDLNFLLDDKNKVVAVNSFVISEYYERIKPDYYVLNAPEYWLEVISEFHKRMRKDVFQNLIAKTYWDLTLFVPYEASNSKVWQGLFIDSSNIKIVYYNKTPVEGLVSVNHFLFKKNLGMPRPHNVLIPSIILSINMGYKKIYLVGADHSWHEEIKVDGTNKVTVNHQHFNDKDELRLPMYKLDGKEYRIHDIFRKLYLAFKGYFVLSNYAKENNVEILNVSKRSYIDAFKKTTVKNALNTKKEL
jgi:hypothetical protein